MPKKHHIRARTPHTNRSFDVSFVLFICIVLFHIQFGIYIKLCICAANRTAMTNIPLLVAMSNINEFNIHIWSVSEMELIFFLLSSFSSCDVCVHLRFLPLILVMLLCLVKCKDKLKFWFIFLQILFLRKIQKIIVSRLKIKKIDHDKRISSTF